MIDNAIDKSVLDFKEIYDTLFDSYESKEELNLQLLILRKKLETSELEERLKTFKEKCEKDYFLRNTRITEKAINELANRLENYEKDKMEIKFNLSRICKKIEIDYCFLIECKPCFGFGIRMSNVGKVYCNECDGVGSVLEEKNSDDLRFLEKRYKLNHDS